MGNTWEVYVSGEAYRMVHRGEHVLPALWAAWKAKRAGAGCVKVEWR